MFDAVRFLDTLTTADSSPAALPAGGAADPNGITDLDALPVKLDLDDVDRRAIAFAESWRRETKAAGGIHHRS